MTVRSSLFALCVLSLAASTAIAEPPQEQPQPRTPNAPRPGTMPVAPPATMALPREPRREGQPVNVKVEVTISDQRGGTQALKKTVSVSTADGMNGFIRTMAEYTGLGGVPLNVDVEPQIIPDGKIRLRLNLQYSLPAGTGAQTVEAGGLRKTEIHENLSLILDNGKSVVAAQSADPVGDRQVTIDVKATIQK
jgi:hypothetical protein